MVNERFVRRSNLGGPLRSRANVSGYGYGCGIGQWRRLVVANWHQVQRRPVPSMFHVKPWREGTRTAVCMDQYMASALSGIAVCRKSIEQRGSWGNWVQGESI